MNGRHKFQVWSTAQQRWRTAYCRPDALTHNVRLFHAYGHIVRYFSI